MVKDRIYATINVLGLTIGLCACMLVGTVVLDDLSYDKFWTNKNELYRIITVDTASGMEGRNASAYANLGNELKNNFPEVVGAASVSPSGTLLLRKDKAGDETFSIDVIRADTNVWNMLDFQVLAGNPQQYVAGVGNLVISEHFRDSYFPDEDPVGKTIYSLSTYSDEATPYLITGVIANLPNNSYLRADGLRITKPTSHELSREGWGFYDEQILLMKPHTDMAAFAEKANRWYRDFLTDASASTRKRIPVYEFQSIKDSYLHSDFAFQRVKGSFSNIYIFSIVAALLLAIACINFVNLSTARAIRRLRETGVRKVLGAARRQLVAQFLVESLLFFSLSTLLACGLYALSYPLLERFIGHELTVGFLRNVTLLLLLVAAILIVTVITGSYPAWVMSGSKVSNALRSKLGNKSITNTSGVRKTLVVVQFSIALLVLVGMVTVWKQVRYMEQKDLGYSPANTVATQWFSTDGKGGALKQALAQVPGVEQVALVGWIPTQGSGNMKKRLAHPERPDERVEVSFITGDADLPRVLEFQLKNGRLFDHREEGSGFTLDMLSEGESEAERQQYALMAKSLITASTAKLFGITEADMGRPNTTLGITPVGIIADFHSISLHEPITPTVIVAEDNLRQAALLINVQQGRERDAMQSISKVWKAIYPNRPPLQPDWLDDLVAKQYEKEAKQGQLFTFFSALTLFLATLGVFGLVVHATEQRVKEIGVRKVLGASVMSIVRLFSIDYVKLVGVALLVASPIAWWAMNTWLEDFAYRIEMEWWMFAAAGLAAVVIALLTVSGQAIRAALANPVDSLRDE
ncbi:putative ABC transport system permease protein [Parapedobacter luteus]|uniref:Putative ABC transport system permease protein n=2 Tax=Parapedobacter luteus TaxID=623280 RepID=A0A1T5EB82_9SPHI|nr:putative ABC transport system permease protein [Parapedobacter luteus]